MGRPQTITDPLGRVTTLTYGDTYLNVTEVTDALGNVNQMTYDANGNVLTRTNATATPGPMFMMARIASSRSRIPLTKRDSAMEYDYAGNVRLHDGCNMVTARNSRIRSTNRLRKVVDAAGEHFI